MTGHCICGEDEPCSARCSQHDRVLHGYPCGACHREWQAANPATSAAISRLAEGNGSLAAVAAGRRADAARTGP